MLPKWWCCRLNLVHCQFFSSTCQSPSGLILFLHECVCVKHTVCHPKAKECLECGPPKGRQRSPFPPPGAGCASSQSGCPWRRPQLDRCRRGWPAALTTCAAATCPFERWKRLSAGSAPAGLHSLDALGEQSPHREVRGALMRTSLIHPTMIQFQLIIRPVSHRSAWLQQQISQRPYRRDSRTRSKINTWDEHCLIISYTTHLDRCHCVDPCGVHVELIHSQMDFISFLAIPTNVHVYQGLRVDKQQAVSRRYSTVHVWHKETQQKSNSVYLLVAAKMWRTWKTLDFTAVCLFWAEQEGERRDIKRQVSCNEKLLFTVYLLSLCDSHWIQQWGLWFSCGSYLNISA